MIKIALNGGKPKEESPNLPTTFEEYKKEIDWFQAHGLQSRLPGTLHHPNKKNPPQRWLRGSLQ